MDARFGYATFRIFRNVYECAIDDLIAVYGQSFSFCALKWEKLPANRENNDLVLHLTYRGEPVLAWESRGTTVEYHWRPRSRLH